MNDPIYKPKGKALEYADYALNIYTGCPHGCAYCYVPRVLRISREQFHSDVRPREGIVEATKKQLASGKYEGKLIHLCFTCDPYPLGYDTSVTREIIKAIKDAWAYVQILTKNGVDAMRDFSLLDSNDWYGVTITGGQESESNAGNEMYRHISLAQAKRRGIKTWVSCEPVIIPERIYELITSTINIDLYCIGKLNYAPSDIDWGAFGRECERLCKEYGRNYMIKEELRKEMEEK